MQKAKGAYQRNRARNVRVGDGRVGLGCPCLQKKYNASAEQTQLASGSLAGQRRASPAKAQNAEAFDVLAITRLHPKRIT